MTIGTPARATALDVPVAASVATSGQSRRWALAAVSIGAAVYLVLITILWLPSVHYYYDAVAIRDAGTVWSSLTWDIADKKHFLPAAVLMHIEGPLQFLLLNGYYGLIGNLLPLKPSTTQLPNVALALWAGAMAMSLGTRWHSKQFGLLWGAVLLAMPWLAVTLRLPWFFTLLSVALQLTCLRCAVAWADAPDAPRARFAAAASVALFLLAAPDWPAFLAVLAAWYLAAGMLRRIVRNPYFLLPVAVLMVHAAWAAAVYRYGAGDPVRQDLYQYSFLLYPFMKIGGSAWPSAARLGSFLWSTFGVALPCALAGVAMLVIDRRRGWRGAPVIPDARRRQLLMMLWLAGGLLVLCRNAGSATYGYVVAVPMAWCAATALLRTPGIVRVAMIVALLVMQVSAGPLRALATWRQGGDDRRVLAAAAFLNRERPDLLTAEKSALLPRPSASNVGQYARGRNQRVILPEDFPTTKRIRSVSSPEPELRRIVDTYLAGGGLAVDWLVVTSELVGPSGASPAFFRRLLDDPGISWIAALHDGYGRSMWIGEVRRSAANRTAREAPAYPIDPLADEYERTYDRIRFLRTNSLYVDHY